MLIDITLPVTKQMLKKDPGSQQATLLGHTGTHFDVMDKEFPLEYTSRPGVVFDVSQVKDREIEASDVDMALVEKDMFVAFYTGFVEEVEYGTAQYFKNHPQLSKALIEELLAKKVSVIGLAFAGIRRTPEHVPADQRCADHGVFVVENLWDLKSLLAVKRPFIVHTYPMRFAGVTGIPCRVVAKL